MNRTSVDRAPIVHTRKGARKREVTATKLKAALTNGSTLLDCDHRSGWMRRLRDLIVQHEADLGGADFVSESERRLIRRAAMLTLQCELMEQKWAANDGEAGAASLDLYQRTAGNLRRLLESLGLKRVARDISAVTLSDYLAPRQSSSAMSIESYLDAALRQGVEDQPPIVGLTYSAFAIELLQPDRFALMIVHFNANDAIVVDVARSCVSSQQAVELASRYHIETINCDNDSDGDDLTHAMVGAFSRSSSRGTLQ